MEQARIEHAPNGCLLTLLIIFVTTNSLLFSLFDANGPRVDASLNTNQPTDQTERVYLADHVPH